MATNIPQPHKGKIAHNSKGLSVKLPEDHPMYAMASRRDGIVPRSRLALAEKLGRPLLREELVVFANGDQSDLRPENLSVRVRKKAPANEMISCACGCGEKLLKYHPENGNERKFMLGHSSRTQTNYWNGRGQRAF